MVKNTWRWRCVMVLLLTLRLVMVRRLFCALAMESELLWQLLTQLLNATFLKFLFLCQTLAESFAYTSSHWWWVIVLVSCPGSWGSNQVQPKKSTSLRHSQLLGFPGKLETYQHQVHAHLFVGSVAFSQQPLVAVATSFCDLMGRIICSQSACTVLHNIVAVFVTKIPDSDVSLHLPYLPWCIQPCPSRALKHRRCDVMPAVSAPQRTSLQKQMPSTHAANASVPFWFPRKGIGKNDQKRSSLRSSQVQKYATNVVIHAVVRLLLVVESQRSSCNRVWQHSMWCPRTNLYSHHVQSQHVYAFTHTCWDANT